MTIEEFATTVLLTKNGRDSFLTRLEIINTKTSQGPFPLAKLNQIFLPEEAAFLKNYLKNAKENEVKKLIEELKNKLIKLPILYLKIPILPSPSLFSKIKNFLVVNKIKALIDLKYEPSLLAGAVLEYNGKFADLSFKSFLEQKGEI